MVGGAGTAMLWSGLVLGASLLVGALLAVAVGLVVAGVLALLVAEFVLAPKRPGRRR